MTQRKNFIRGQCVLFLFVIMLFSVSCVSTAAAGNIGITICKSEVAKCGIDNSLDWLKYTTDSTSYKEQSAVKHYTNNTAKKLSVNILLDKEVSEGPDELDSILPAEPGYSTEIHNHSYSVYETESPGCTSDGYTTYRCSCGEIYTSDIVTARGHNWSVWKTTVNASTTAAGEEVRTCFNCGISECRSTPKLPVDTNTEPDTCSHDWQVKYFPEEGHYGEYYNVCKCGWRFGDPSEWAEHVKNAGSDAVLYHTNWGSNQDYIIDSPERYEWHCSICGEVTLTQP